MGEAPHWDQNSQSLYYVDIYGTEYSVLHYVPSEDIVYGAKIYGEPVVSFIIPVEGTSDEFVVGIGARVGVIHWDGIMPEAHLIRVLIDGSYYPEYSHIRFNDAKADPYGRLFAGTMRKEECDNLEIPTYGNLYRISADQPTAALIAAETIRCSNGLTWNAQINKFYHIDSCDFGIKEFDYYPSTGDIGEFYTTNNSHR